MASEADVTKYPSDVSKPTKRDTSGKIVKEHDIFVGNLSLYTTEERLKAYFSKFGDVTDVRVLLHPVSKRSRRFGFVTFVDCASVQAVFASPKLVLDGKEIEVKSAFKKIEEQLGVQSILPMQESCKIFVGGISQETTENEIKEHFSKFGTLNGVRLIKNQMLDRHKGFCFLTFKSAEGAKSACKEKFQMLKNKKVEVSVADERKQKLTANKEIDRRALDLNTISWLQNEQDVTKCYPSPSLPPQHSGGGPIRTPGLLNSVRYNPYSLTAPQLPYVVPPSTSSLAEQVSYFYYPLQPPVLTPPFPPPSFLTCYRPLYQAQIPQPTLTFPPPVASPAHSPVEPSFYYIISPQLIPSTLEGQTDL